MEVSINPFHVRQGYFFPQYHFVEGADEESIEEAAVKYSQSYHAADKFEVVQMFWIDAGMRIDL